MDVKANACAGISQEQKSSASSLEIQIQKHVLGGSAVIRDELASSVGIDDSQLIQTFLDSAGNSSSPVSYMLTQTVWDFMASRMGNRGSDSSTVNAFNRHLAAGVLVNSQGKWLISAPKRPNNPDNHCHFITFFFTLIIIIQISFTTQLHQQ